MCSKVCFEQDDVREILTKCRAYIGTVYKYNNALAALRIQDHLMSVSVDSRAFVKVGSSSSSSVKEHRESKNFVVYK